MKVVIKRDGSRYQFNPEKITNAIMKAQESVGVSNYKEAKYISEAVEASLSDLIDIPSIQDKVEQILKDCNYEVFKAYSSYRKERDRIRDANSVLARNIKALVDRTDTTITNENANKDSKVFPVQRDLMAGLVSKHFAHLHLPPHILEAHESGDIHFHDLDYSPFLPMTNCCLVDLRGLLKNGFRLGSAQIESPKSFGVACAVTAQIIAQVASHQYGGTTIANIDQVLSEYAEMSWDKWYLVGSQEEVRDPEGYANRRTMKEIYDGVQAMEYEINTLFTTNGQQPFVTFSFGMGDSWYEREIQKAILNVRLKGLGKNGITAVFPKLVMFLEEGLNLKQGDPNYDIKQLALKCSARRLYPDIISAKNNRRITGSSVPVSPMGK